MIDWTLVEKIQCTGPCVSTIEECPTPIKGSVGKKKAKQMSYDCDCDGYSSTSKEMTIEDRRLDHARTRISGIWETKYDELRKQFCLDESKPKTPEELIEKIKAGKFILKSEEFRRARSYWDAIDFIEWKDKPADEEGYDKALKALNETRGEAEDQIFLGTDALGAISKFAAWKYTA